MNSTPNSDINPNNLDEVTEDGNAYDNLLYWLSLLNTVCTEADDQVYVFLSKEAKDQVRWNKLKWMLVYIHSAQTWILDEFADANLYYHGQDVAIRHDGRPKLVLAFRDGPDGEFSTLFTTSNLRVWG